MHAFDQKLKEYREYPLRAKGISRLFVNMGDKCNLRCTHCYVDSSPEKTNEMSLDTINKILKVLDSNNIPSIEISGGAPEYNPHYKYFIKAAAATGTMVTVCSNAVVFFEPGMEDIPEFLAENGIKIYVSLPGTTEEDVDKQRGKGAFNKIIAALKRLNGLGYGKDGTSLELDLMFAPFKASTAPDERILEGIFREKLKENYDITFSNFLAANIMPIGRMRKRMSDDEFNRYMKELEDRFNPDTLDALVCRHMPIVSYDEMIYDCDFWRLIGLPHVKCKGTRIEDFDFEELKHREIVTNPLCFVCTAGQGCGQSFVKRELISNEGV